MRKLWESGRLLRRGWNWAREYFFSDPPAHRPPPLRSGVPAPPPDPFTSFSGVPCVWSWPYLGALFQTSIWPSAWKRPSSWISFARRVSPPRRRPQPFAVSLNVLAYYSNRTRYRRRPDGRRHPIGAARPAREVTDHERMTSPGLFPTLASCIVPDLCFGSSQLSWSLVFGTPRPRTERNSLSPGNQHAHLPDQF